MPRVNKPFVANDDFYYPPASGKVYADSEDKYLRSVFVYGRNRNPITGESDDAIFAYLDEAGTKPLWADMAYALFKKSLIVVFYTEDTPASGLIYVTDVPYMYRVFGVSPIFNDSGSADGVTLITGGDTEFLAPNRPSDSETESQSTNPGMESNIDPSVFEGS